MNKWNKSIFRFFFFKLFEMYLKFVTIPTIGVFPKKKKKKCCILFSVFCTCYKICILHECIFFLQNKLQTNKILIEVPLRKDLENLTNEFTAGCFTWCSPLKGKSKGRGIEIWKFFG